MKWCRAILVLLAVALVSGCAGITNLMDYREMQTDVKMAETIFLEPIDASKKTVYMEIRNTSSNQKITNALKEVIISGIKSSGYFIASSPSSATYILQVNIRYLGEYKQGMDFGGAMTGAGIGALTGIGLWKPGGNMTGSMVTGGIIGAAAGLVFDATTRTKTQVILVDLRVQQKGGSPKVTAVAAKAEQIGLNPDEAAQALIKISGEQIAGIF